MSISTTTVNRLDIKELHLKIPIKDLRSGSKISSNTNTTVSF